MYCILQTSLHTLTEIVEACNTPKTWWFAPGNNIFLLVGHNCVNPLRLPSHCSPELYNGIWLLTTQKTFYFCKIKKMFRIFFLCKISSGRIFCCFKPIFARFLIKSHWLEKKTRNNFDKNLPYQPCQPLNRGGKVLKIPFVSIVPKSVNVWVSCLTTNLLEVLSSHS